MILKNDLCWSLGEYVFLPAIVFDLPAQRNIPALFYDHLQSS